MAIVTLNEEEANHLLKTARINRKNRKGWVTSEEELSSLDALYVLPMVTKLEHVVAAQKEKDSALNAEAVNI